MGVAERAGIDGWSGMTIRPVKARDVGSFEKTNIGDAILDHCNVFISNV